MIRKHFPERAVLALCSGARHRNVPALNAGRRPPVFCTTFPVCEIKLLGLVLVCEKVLETLYIGVFRQNSAAKGHFPLVSNPAIDFTRREGPPATGPPSSGVPSRPSARPPNATPANRKPRGGARRGGRGEGGGRIGEGGCVADGGGRTVTLAVVIYPISCRQHFDIR